MHTINITIKNRIAIAEANALLVCNNEDYRAVFSFDEEWAEIDTKTARFYANGKYSDVIFSGNEVNIPPILQAQYVHIGVFAGEMTTTPALVKCENSILCKGGEVADPPPDVYEQLMNALNDLKENGVTDEQLTTAIEKYLIENPFETGATKEQAAQIEQNARDIAKLKETGGTAGADGKDGKDGVSCTHVWEGTTLTITSASGTSSADLKGEKGEKGDAGEQGLQGEKGDTGERGERGIQGEKGDTGERGERGIQGEKGETGAAGANGKDGISITHSWNGTTLTVTSASGTSAADLKGEKGEKGDAGKQGERGIQGEKGETGATGEKGDTGDAGYTPQKGVDYWTEDDKTEIINALKNSTGEIEWLTFPHNSSNVTNPDDSCVYTKNNNMVNIQGGIKLKTALAKDATVEIGTLPEGFRPYRSISNAQMLGGALFRVNISTAGSVTVTNFNSNSLSNSYSLPLNIVFTTGD